MISRIAYRQLFRFCAKKDNIAERQASFLTDTESAKEGEVPVHLRPYDKAKYEVPSKSIKRNSGYAMVQIEPFPRGRIMKLCLNILADVKKGLPEDLTFRIVTEEKMKYIMNIVDKEEDIGELEKLFGSVPIQIFIRNLSDQFTVIESIRRLKPWELDEEDKEAERLAFQQNFKIPDQPKYPKYRRPERTKSVLL